MAGKGKPEGEHERVEVASVAELRDWLRANHRQGESIWLVTYKKHVGDKYVAKDDIVDEVLCWGWIDSLPRKLDADRTMLRLSPRKRGSQWSKINKDKVARLEKQRRMRAPGRRKVEQAKADGSWSFLDDVEALVKPDDLVAALADHPGAAENFDAFPPSAQRGLLGWIKLAKTPATRSRRIAMTAEKAAQNVMANFPPERAKR